jgi:hypothetical protein
MKSAHSCRFFSFALFIKDYENKVLRIQQHTCSLNMKHYPSTTNHRTPRGKRTAWSADQLLSKATVYEKKEAPLIRTLYSLNDIFDL